MARNAFITLFINMIRKYTYVRFKNSISLYKSLVLKYWKVVHDDEQSELNLFAKFT